MKTDHSFIPERALANHCPELFPAEQGQAEQREADRAEFTGTLAKNLSQHLQGSLAGEKLAMSITANGAETASSLGQRVAAQSANFLLLCGARQTPFTVSFGLKTAIALTDRMFGGTGAPPDEEVETLPQSARLVLDQLAQNIATALRDAAGVEGPVEVAAQHASFARLEAFPRGDYCLSWDVKVQQKGAQDWQMQIAAREADLDALLGGDKSARSKQQQQPRSPFDKPFGDIPLPMRAVLAEFPLPLSRLSRLKPDDLIPLALARQVPLQLGTRIFAHGSIGTQDDRIALRLGKIMEKDVTQ